MFNRKRIISVIISSALALTAAGCANSGNSSANTTAKTADSSEAVGKKLSIVCTIFPEYDWVREILGSRADSADITYLLDNGVDLHSYQPTAEDIMKISTCDLFIYVGGESDEWVEDALAQAQHKDMKVINLMEVLGDKAKEEEIKEGMQEEEHEHEHEHEDGEPEYDEHVWLSLKNAEILCAEIESDIEALDPDNADTYRTNLESYTEKLISLDSDLKTLIDSAGETALIFGDRFPFRYFADDYGIDYYAAFVGCSAETEASFETVAFLAAKADEFNADTIYTIENSDGRIAQAVIDASSSKYKTIAVLNSVQSVSQDDIKNGTTYLSLMQQNYETLKTDLK